MYCKCNWTETIIGIVILIVALWPDLVGDKLSNWVLILAAILLILHAWTCNGIKMCSENISMKNTAMKKKKKR